MDIFKLIFEHDITLEHLSGNDDPRRQNDRDNLLESFLKPQQTYNRYYFTGTRIREERFGLNVLAAYPDIVKTLNTVFSQLPDTGSGSSPVISKAPADKAPANEISDSTPASGWHRTDGTRFESLTDAVHEMQPFEVIISGRTSDHTARTELILDEQTGIRERFKPLASLLDHGHFVLISEKAHHGIDLHLFSRHNLYEQLFESFRKMVHPEFRYFSINGKRVGSERQFYFETWTLERPPHGFQEVTPEARIR